MNTYKASVIISTYNQPVWLEKVLWSYEVQTVKDFEIIIADDGSTSETKALIDVFIKHSLLKITHVWQEDKGFRKTKILNKGIVKSRSDYLIFTDGDCIARKDFVETHLKLKRDNWFLSGGYFKLPKAVSYVISKEDIKTQQCFDIHWLLLQGVPNSFKINKLNSKGFKELLLNTFTTTKATFDGMNISGYKTHILKVNGFDERMEYGGEDRELGERLINNGIKFKQIRYSAICIHLFHQHDYVDEAMIKRNNHIRKATKLQKLTYTNFGINKV